ncbi:MAG: nucleotidyltransferase domain-containing protein [Verrucomicrobiia bacterium]
MLEVVVEWLRAWFKTRDVSVIYAGMFGSATRQDTNIQDIDLLVIIPSSRELEEWRKVQIWRRALLDNWSSCCSTHIDLVILSREEAKEMNWLIRELPRGEDFSIIGSKTDLQNI